MGKKKIADDVIRESYLRLQNVWKVGKEVGICGQSVHERVKKLGIVNENKIPEWKIKAIRKLYTDGFMGGDGKLESLCIKVGIEKPNVSREARRMGLSNANRDGSEAFKDKCSKKIKEWHKNNDHPKGYTGHKHSAEVLDKISKASLATAAKRTPEERSDIALKGLKTKEKNGTLVTPRQKTTWKQGWREIGGIRKYYRSRWEANYARYLEWLRVNKQIKKWEHEPKTFWFEGIMRGCRSYLPDFRVTENNGAIVYHEVKGWMDDRSKTKIKRMAKYHPDIKLLVIDSKGYKALAKQMSNALNGWE